MGTTDRKFSREICIANLTCPFISTLSLHYVWSTHQPSRAASSVTDLKVSQTTRHTFPVSNLPRAYLSCYLLTVLLSAQRGSRALLVNDKSKNVFFSRKERRSFDERQWNIGFFDKLGHGATRCNIYINVVPLWILNEKNYEEISANAQFLFMTDGERENHCCNSRRKCFWEDIFFQITWKNDIPDDIRDSTKLLKKNNFSSFWPFVNWHSTSRNVNRIVKNKMSRGGRWRHNFDTYIINV